MKLFVTPVPLLDKNMVVDSYYFRYQKSDNLFIFDQLHTQFDNSIHCDLIELLNNIGLEAFTNGKPIFIPISNMHLLTIIDEISETPAGSVVFTINKSVTSEPKYLDRIKELKKIGYKFAFKLPDDYEPYLEVIDLMNYVMVNQNTSNKKNALNLLKRHPDIKSIASYVNTYNMFNLSKATGYSLFEGKFYRKPLTIGHKEISPLKANSIKLMNVVQDVNFDIHLVSKIVQKDTSLAISLVSLVNSQLISGQKIHTIAQAAAMLGQVELRKWVSTAASATLSADKPNEINKLSLVRAKFAEELAPLFNLEDDAQSLFLMGLFSVLDVVLDRSIEEALEVISVADNIRNALVYDKGPYFLLYEFILYYEMADWTSVSRLVIVYNLDVEKLYDAYIHTLEWYRDLIAANQ